MNAIIDPAKRVRSHENEATDLDFSGRKRIADVRRTKPFKRWNLLFEKKLRLSEFCAKLEIGGGKSLGVRLEKKMTASNRQTCSDMRRTKPFQRWNLLLKKKLRLPAFRAE